MIQTTKRISKIIVIKNNKKVKTHQVKKSQQINLTKMYLQFLSLAKRKSKNYLFHRLLNARKHWKYKQFCKKPRC